MTNIRFEGGVLQPDPERRALILPVLEAALAAADPAVAVQKSLVRDREHLHIGDATYDLDAYRHVYVVGFGKAVTPMAEATLQILDDRVHAGVVVTKVGHGPEESASLGPIAVLVAGHPVPDEAGRTATQKVVDLLQQAGEDDLVICLISGGGSALLTLPAEDVSLTDLQEITNALLRCGANIHEINTIRKHLSQVKGGQLARWAAPATIVSLVVSDVVGSALDIVASGPTVPDNATWENAWAVLQRYALIDELPETVEARLQAGLRGELPDTPKPGDVIFERTQTLIIADNALAAEAARHKAADMGFDAAILTTFLEGEAREVAKVVVSLGREVIWYGHPVTPPACLILGGETTVTIRGSGKGGRNQELALAAALVLDQLPEGERLVILSLATDGTDGPTDSAGAVVDSTTVERGNRLALTADQHLAINDSYPYLLAVSDLLQTGPTRTNVNDLVFVFVF